MFANCAPYLCWLLLHPRETLQEEIVGKDPGVIERRAPWHFRRVQNQAAAIFQRKMPNLHRLSCKIWFSDTTIQNCLSNCEKRALNWDQLGLLCKCCTIISCKELPTSRFVGVLLKNRLWPEKNAAIVRRWRASFKRPLLEGTKKPLWVPRS